MRRARSWSQDDAVNVREDLVDERVPIEADNDQHHFAKFWNSRTEEVLGLLTTTGCRR